LAIFVKDTGIWQFWLKRLDEAKKIDGPRAKCYGSQKFVLSKSVC